MKQTRGEMPHPETALSFSLHFTFWFTNCKLKWTQDQAAEENSFRPQTSFATTEQKERDRFKGEKWICRHPEDEIR
jgi:hypothetical protein